MGFLVLAILLGLIPAALAHSKGRDFFLWWLYGAVVFIVALPHALLLKPDLRGQGMKLCPACAESVKAAALVCRYCGHRFPPASTTPDGRVVGGIVLREGDDGIDTALNATFRRSTKDQAS